MEKVNLEVRTKTFTPTNQYFHKEHRVTPEKLHGKRMKQARKNNERERTLDGV